LEEEQEERVEVEEVMVQLGVLLMVGEEEVEEEVLPMEVMARKSNGL
jgi:hypothetical protein